MGGTFDPVHLGHMQMAEAAVAALGLDQDRFLPCQISPHKTATTPTAAADRLEMLRLATQSFDWAVVDDHEIRQDGPSYSYRTAEEMAARFPEADLFWIMGCDQWDALPNWANPERLAACVEFIVFARDHQPHPRDGYRLHVVEGVHPASATVIRECITSDKMFMTHNSLFLLF
jgi:nicotinate-nucleotide adenylyltransferase